MKENFDEEEDYSSDDDDEIESANDMDAMDYLMEVLHKEDYDNEENLAW